MIVINVFSFIGKWPCVKMRSCRRIFRICVWFKMIIGNQTDQLIVQILLRNLKGGIWLEIYGVHWFCLFSLFCPEAYLLDHVLFECVRKSNCFLWCFLWFDASRSEAIVLRLFCGNMSCIKLSFCSPNSYFAANLLGCSKISVLTLFCFVFLQRTWIYSMSDCGVSGMFLDTFW